MAEFPGLGKHCSVSDCKVLDFLPFECDGCKRTFCLDHRSPSTHECSIDEKSVICKTTASVVKALKRCNFSSCKVRDHILVTCPSCGQEFCLHHRHQQDHNCITLTVTNSNGTKTAELVKSILESKNNKDKRPKELTGRASSKINTQVQLMKLKAKAVGLKTIPLSDRVYLELTLPDSSSSKPYFFSKIWTVGKLIDHVAEAEKLYNFNNVSTAKKLKLFTDLSEENLVMGKTLDELLQQKVIFNGQTAVLKYVGPS